MKKTLRELLMQESLQCAWVEKEDISDAVLEETLRERFNAVHEFPPHYQGRWRSESYVVIAIEDGEEDRFFAYSTCYSTDSNSWEDAGYCFEGIDNVAEVYPKEVITTTYVSEDEL